MNRKVEAEGLAVRSKEKRVPDCLQAGERSDKEGIDFVEPQVAVRRYVASAGEQKEGIESEREIPPGRVLVAQGGWGGCKLIFKLLHRERLAYDTDLGLSVSWPTWAMLELSGGCYSAKEITEAQRRKAVWPKIAYMIMDSDA